MVGSRKLWALIFLLPTLAVLVLVAGWPLARTLYFSLTNATLAEMEKIQFVGLQNFIFLMKDVQWWQSVFNTSKFAVVSVTLETFLGLVIALVMNTQFRGRAWVRGAILIPW